MRISDWSSDVCSSDLGRDVHFIAFLGAGGLLRRTGNGGEHRGDGGHGNETQSRTHITLPVAEDAPADDATDSCFCLAILYAREGRTPSEVGRSEEHTSELQSLMRISYAVFCLKKKNNTSRKYCVQNVMQNFDDQ